MPPPVGGTVINQDAVNLKLITWLFYAKIGENSLYHDIRFNCDSANFPDERIGQGK
jgi:hypothetical protein